MEAAAPAGAAGGSRGLAKSASAYSLGRLDSSPSPVNMDIVDAVTLLPGNRAGPTAHVPAADEFRRLDTPELNPRVASRAVSLHLPKPHGRYANSNLSRLAQQQNIRVEEMLAVLNFSGKAERRHGTGDYQADKATHESDARRFDNAWNEIQRMIEEFRRAEAQQSGEGDALLGMKKEKEIPKAEQQRGSGNAGGSIVDDDDDDIGTQRRPTSSARRSRAKKNTVLELERKLDLLRNNPDEWAHFQAKIAEYRASKAAATAATRNIIDDNKKLTMKQHPRHRREDERERRAQRRQHEQEVAQRRELMRNELLRHRTNIVNRREMKEQMEQEQAKLRSEHEKRRRLYCSWTMVLALASRQQLIVHVLKDARQRRIEQREVITAARRIQRTWRRYYSIKSETRINNALRVITRIVRVYIVKVRRERQYEAAQKIVQFLTDMQETTELVKVIRRYRFAVIKAQTTWRARSKVLQAQRQLLVLQMMRAWQQRRNKLAALLRAELDKSQTKERALKNALVPVRSPRGKRSAGKASTVGLDALNGNTSGLELPDVTEDVWENAVRAFLRRRWAAYIDAKRLFLARMRDARMEKVRLNELAEARQLVKQDQPHARRPPSRAEEMIERVVASLKQDLSSGSDTPGMKTHPPQYLDSLHVTQAGEPYYYMILNDREITVVMDLALQMMQEQCAHSREQLTWAALRKSLATLQDQVSSSPGEGAGAKTPRRVGRIGSGLVTSGSRKSVGSSRSSVSLRSSTPRSS